MEHASFPRSRRRSSATTSSSCARSRRRHCSQHPHGASGATLALNKKRKGPTSPFLFVSGGHRVGTDPAQGCRQLLASICPCPRRRFARSTLSWPRFVSEAVRSSRRPASLHRKRSSESAPRTGIRRHGFRTLHLAVAVL